MLVDSYLEVFLAIALEKRKKEKVFLAITLKIILAFEKSKNPFFRPHIEHTSFHVLDNGLHGPI